MTPKKIISVTADNIIVIEVVDPLAKKFGRSYEFAWDLTSLGTVLSEIVKRFGSYDFRALVSDELSHTLRIKIPSGVTSQKTRDFVLKKLKEQIPEDIGEEWDYREITSHDEVREVIAFILKKNFAKAFFEAVAAVGINIEAIEPEIVAKTRDPNPYIGLALKKDLEGADEDVLNIRRSTRSSKISPPVILSERRQRKIDLKIVAILAISTLIGIFVGGLIYWGKAVPKITSEMEEKTPVPTPTSTPTRESQIDLKNLKVQILNGSGIKGEANKVARRLELVGFEDIETANADSFDFDKTEVSLKEKYSALLEIIEQELGDEYEVVKNEEVLDESEDFDIVIILGVKK